MPHLISFVLFSLKARDLNAMQLQRRYHFYRPTETCWFGFNRGGAPKKSAGCKTSRSAEISSHEHTLQRKDSTQNYYCNSTQKPSV